VREDAKVTAAAISEADAVLLVNKVAADSSLPRAVRQRARRLLPRAGTPALVLNRLQEVAEDYVVTLPRVRPTVALTRAITVSTFWKHYCRADVRARFNTAEDLARYIGSDNDPAGVLRDFLDRMPYVVEWKRSWLAEARQLRGLSGRQVADALELGQDPPLVLLQFDLPHLLAQGVTVRKPCALDSTLGPNLQWRPGGPVSGLREYVDSDIPLAALTQLDWRP
jgi:hypothetical protein